MNFLTGVVIIAFLFSGAQAFNVDCILGVAPEFEQTGENGLMKGDHIYKVNGYRTYLVGDAQLFLSYAGDTADLEVVRNGRHILLEDLERGTYSDMQGNTYRGFGVYLGATSLPATLGTKVQYIWYQALSFVQQVWFSLVQLVRGTVGVQELSGPVGIVSTMTEVGEAAATFGVAIQNLAYFASLLAVNLAVMNLLPIPALDGGRIFFLLVDAIALLLFRKKVPEKYQATVNTAGFVLLMGFMLMVTFQDVFKLFQ